jgi:tetratricopeptide (TPR) repeat protein
MNAGKQYKFLSIRQPLAWAVCVGEKTVENKSNNTSHRGPLLIHAGKNVGGLSGLKKLQGWKTYKDYFALGAIIGAVDLYNAVEFNRSLETNLHANGPWCYLLRNPKWFAEPIACKGQLGILPLPEELTAQVESQLNKPGRVIQIPEELLGEIRPLPTDACCYQGRHYLEHGLPEDALRRFEGAINLDKSNATAYFLKSLALDEMEEPEEAIKAVSEAIRLEGDTPAYLCNRAVYYRTLKRLPESMQDINKFIVLEPGLEIGYWLRGFNYCLSKDFVSALSDLNRAQTINPDNVETKLLKGAVLLESGKTAEGIEELKAAERQFPDDPWPSYFLYRGYKKANQRELASAALELFNEKDGEEKEVKGYLESIGFSL